MPQRVDGLALGSVAVGSVLLYAGITGKSVPAALQAVIQGKSPASGSVAYPIQQVKQTSATKAAISTTTGGNGGTAIPPLGTTLPPESVMVQYFGPKGDPSHEVTIPFAGKTLQINRAVASNAAALGMKLTAAGYNSYIRDVGGFRTSVG